MQARLNFTKAYCDNTFIETGKRQDSSIRVTIPTEELTPDDRRILLELENLDASMFDRLPAFNSWEAKRFEIGYLPADLETWHRLILDYAEAVREAQAGVEVQREEAFQAYLEQLDEASDTADDTDFLQKLYGIRRDGCSIPDCLQKHPARAEAEAKLKDLLARKQSVEARRDEERRTMAKAAEALREAEKAREEANRVEWIQQHGSGRLRKAHQLGFECHNQYIMERVVKQFGDEWIVDLNDLARWDEWTEREIPSLEAIMELEAARQIDEEAELVMLTYPPYRVDEEAVWIPCEAIRIRLMGLDVIKGVHQSLATIDG